MRQLSLLCLVLMTNFVGCSCDEVLTYTCPDPKPCLNLVDGGIEVLEDDFVPRTKGECRLGHTECDENNRDICVGQIKPIEETCDGLDNDCDGLIDDGLFTDNDNDSYNTSESCLGPKTDCDDNDPTVFPGNDEVCDGVDNDCDGEIDNIGPFECWTGGESAVFNENSPCRTGVVECVDGTWSGCLGQVFPVPEQCDLIDNDCNGEVDDSPWGEGDACGPESSIGQCSYGYSVCITGEMYCIDAMYPQNEACDAVDNDCNGFIDESLERLCETECGYGIEECSDGSWVNCSAPTPSFELCDNIDNDCDGEVDEGCLCIEGDTRICVEEGMLNQSTGEVMSCGQGIQICDLVGMWGDCLWVGPAEEICNNWDDDCDDIIDMMQSSCGNQDSITVGVAECKLGIATCIEGEWGTCEGEIAPTEEICDGLDNDCDGEIDEDLNPHEKVDMVFAIDISGSMCGYIEALAQGIIAYVADFADTEHKFSLVVFPPPGQGAPVGQYQPRYKVMTIPPLVNVTSFLFQLASLDCDGGGIEPGYDTMYDLVLPNDPAGIGWRHDAYPYIIMITDEPAQSWGNLDQTHIAPHTSNCALGECIPGDKIEVFVISKPGYLWGWDNVLYGELNRFYAIDPADGNRYTVMLQDIFTNICIPGVN